MLNFKPLNKLAQHWKIQELHRRYWHEIGRVTLALGYKNGRMMYVGMLKGRVGWTYQSVAQEMQPCPQDQLHSLPW